MFQAAVASLYRYFHGLDMHPVLRKQQEEMLDSFVNVQQYDKLLLYLESSLFSSAPILICPSSFIIKILLTLATIGEYSNADLIRREFSSPSSDGFLHKRALEILVKLVSIVKQNTPISDDPFASPGYDPEDVEYAETQLIDSLDFLVDDIKMKKLRARVIKKNYKERKFLEKRERQRDKEVEMHSYTHKNDITTTPKKNGILQPEELEWSPQKRQMEREFAKLKEDSIRKMDGDDDTESDDEIENTALKKSFRIFRNDRLDIALNESKIWNVISWALRCSLNDKDPISRESWNVWNPLLTVIIDILELEFQKFVIEKEEGKDVIFEETLSNKFLSKVGRYSWGRKVAEFTLTEKSSKVLPIYNNETTHAKSVLLGNALEHNSDCKLVTSESGQLQRKILLFASRAAEHRNANLSISSHTLWRTEDIVEYLIPTLRDATYNDFVNFFKLDKEILETQWKVYTMQEFLINYLVQITTYEFNQPLPSAVYESSSIDFVKDLFQNVSFEKKHYVFDAKVDLVRMKTDFNKLNIVLYELFKIWLVCSKFKLSKDDKCQLMELAKKGEESRLEALKKAAKASDDFDTTDLKFLSSWLKMDGLTNS